MDFEEIEIQNSASGQAIRIPENFKINDDKVYVKRVGNGLFIIPYHEPWQGLFDSLHLFSPDFMESRDQPSSQERDTFDS